MTPRERVRAALRHRPPDRVPWGELVVPPALAAARAGRAPRDGLERLVMQRELQEELGIDLAVVDAGGCLQQGVKAAAMREVRFWAGESDRFVVALLPGGLSWARDLLGWQELFRQLARQQAQLEELFQQAHLALARAAGPLCAAGVEMVMVADDIAHRQGPLADPHNLRRAYF
ncbi:MAG: hypothetical protein NUV35_04395, partial [Syntrophomonadaceae bacterium]|nr:hypothetical protein [Syntrophomonadaceae bacterium]